MTENNRVNIQDRFLNAARRQNVPLSVFVTNGYVIKEAKVISFDNFSILLEANGKQMLVYKHAVSTITPDLPVELNREGENE